MPLIPRALVLLSLALVMAVPAAAQTELDERAQIEVHDGITIRKDSVFLLNLRFRMQNRFGLTSVAGDALEVATVDARVRRLRLRFDGYVLRDRLRYYIQLNFSHSDLDLDGGGVAKPIRDAMVYYHVNERFYFGFGQSKLPGNRQRVVSSGNLQFPERSIANGAYTLDRDFGLFTYWTLPVGPQQVQVKAALSTGDGRSATPGNSGLSYTGRVEWLPMGAFANSGDYSEGDLEMEPKPKLAIGVSAHHNDRAHRTGGQLGAELYAHRSFSTLIADWVLKYRGWALSGEFFERRSDDPITTDAEGDVRFVRTGQGANIQLSRYWRSRYELAMRYSLVHPAADTRMYDRATEDLWLGATRYLNGHRIKVQGYVGYRYRDGTLWLDHPGNAWTAMVQVEFGI